MSNHPPPLVDASAVETLTRRLGHEIFDRIRGSSPWIFQPEWWEEKLLQQCMQNEWFKVQSFRFIDVLPMMRDDRDVARHLREYFAAPAGANGAPRGAANNGTRGAGGATGAHARGGAHSTVDAADLHDVTPATQGAGFVAWVSRAMDFEHLDSLRARLAAWFARRGSVKMAHRFIAGSTPDEAIRTIRRMRDQRLAFTIDVLGEAALSETESEHYQATYLQLIRSLSAAARTWPEVPLIDVGDGKPLARVNVSVKLTSLYSQSDAIDSDASKLVLKERLRPLLRAGMQNGAHVHIDMEHYAIKDLTLELCREVFMEDEFRDYPHFGIVLQAYLRDADRDVAETIEYAKRRGTPLWVRLVKGAYWDTETVHAEQQHWPCPVFEQKWESDACYERCTRALLENWQFVHTAFASHNVRSLAHALALKRLIGVPSWAFELQMLYGMGDPIKRACRDLGERCRIYTPYGELLPGMAYLIRRLLENTANESFLRHSSAHDVSEDVLLENPVEIGRRTPLSEKPPKLLFEFEEPIMDPFENVPNTDFSRRNGRAALASAIREVRTKIGHEVPLVIGGERIVTGQWVESVNPSKPAEVIGRIALADAASTERAVELAFETFKQWRRVSPHERAAYLFEVARIMERRRHELSAIIALECGKPWREADADVSESIDFCNYYGKEMIRIADNLRRRDMPGETNELYYTPRGVVAVISPWNFPLAILTGMTTAALVTGNAVIIKPAEFASVIASKLAEMFEQAHLPRGVLTYLPGKGSVVGEIMVKHPKVAMIAFTGSREVGCRINRNAADVITAQPALKKVIAEMGGKNATIVDTDADLDEAVKGVVYSAFGYAGQKCSACSRAIVLDGVYDRFVPRLIEAARSVQVGPAEDPGTFVPPVIDKNAWASIRKYVEIGKSEAKLGLEVDVSDLVQRTGGYFIGPTIFVDVDPNARIAKEEIFGPVLAVLRARDIDHAIAIFNDVDYGLTGGIFSRSPANIERARHECECGNFYINRKISGALVDLQPFGGFKMSGIGSKAGGPDYLIQFCEPRCVTENTLRRGFAPSEEVAEALG